jgi:hypothetical protein
MYCTSCGNQNESNAKFCLSCGKPLNSSEQPDLITPLSKPSRALEPGRGGLILIFGILSLVLLGPILGIPAWVMGHRDLKKIRAGIIAITQQGSTKSGMILGIIGTFVSPFAIIIVGIAIAVGITMFKTNAASANRDALIGDMTNLAARAQQFYRRPVSLGGGGGVFDNSEGATAGFTLTRKEGSNPNGTYTISSPGAQRIVLQGVGTEISDDGSGIAVTVTMIVDPDSIYQTTIVH